MELNHLIVNCRDARASAEFLAGILGVEVGPPWAHFLPVRTGNGVTLDFSEWDQAQPAHFAFLVGEPAAGRS